MWERVKFMVDNIPQTLCMWIFGRYNPANDHNPATMEFWARELCHFCGGIPFGIILFKAECPTFLIPIFVWMLLMLKEMVDDVPDQGGAIDWKNFADPTFWALGALFAALIMGWIYAN